MSWFVDKLGPAPAQSPPRQNGAAAQTPSQRAQQKGAPAQTKAAPSPEKKKKKGWF